MSQASEMRSLPGHCPCPGTSAWLTSQSSYVAIISPCRVGPVCRSCSYRRSVSHTALLISCKGCGMATLAARSDAPFEVGVSLVAQLVAAALCEVAPAPHRAAGVWSQHCNAIGARVTRHSYTNRNDGGCHRSRSDMLNTVHATPPTSTPQCVCSEAS